MANERNPAETPAEPSPENGESTRRSWLGRMMWGTLALPVGVGVASVVRFLYPLSRTRHRTLYFCRLDEIPLGQRKIFVDHYGREFVVVRTNRGLRALSTKCTHLGCKVLWRADRKEFHCPCHDGWFSAEGKVLSGPPPRPLETIPVVVKDGNVYIRVKEV